MAELRSGMLMDIGFNLLPVTFVIAYLLAMRAYGKQASECSNAGQRLLELGNKFLSFLFGPSAFRYISCDRYAQVLSVFVLEDD